MTARHLPSGRWPALVAAFLGLHACTTDDNMAGGSSEVDNPQVLMAFVDSAGAPKYTTGSLEIFLSDQSPAVNPAPMVEIQLGATAAIMLTPAHLALAGLADSTLSFNLYLRGDDSTGSFLQNLVYNPEAKRFSREDGTAITQLNLTVSSLVRSESVLSGGDTTGINRLIIPGSPFVAVLVDTVFAFEEIPAGVYPVHILAPNGTELPLGKPVDTRAPGQRYQVNPDTTPVVRPPPAPGPPVRALAGEDQTTNLGAAFFLNGEVEGVQGNQEPTVLWRQLPPTHPDARAHIRHPTRLKSKVEFPRPGAYGFILSFAFQNHHTEDTVWIGVLATSENPVFFEPRDSAQYWLGFNQMIGWYAHNQVPDTLDLQFSRDSGATWETVLENTPSVHGFNNRFWNPQGSASTNCYFRLRRNNGNVAATSPRFALVAGYMNMPASIWKPGYGNNDHGYHPDHE